MNHKTGRQSLLLDQVLRRAFGAAWFHSLQFGVVFHARHVPDWQYSRENKNLEVILDLQLSCN